MPSKDKCAVSATIQADGIVPLFYNHDARVCRQVAAAVYDAGSHALEFTNRGKDAMTCFSALRRMVTEQYPDRLLGAGSIIDEADAGRFVESGSDFLVGPGFSEGVARLCVDRGVLYVPGCATVTEILRAKDFGADVVKLFPADALGGPAFLKAIRGPLPWLKAMITGGVKATEGSLREWFDAGAVAVGLGSDLIGKDVLSGGDPGVVTDQLRGLLQVAATCKGRG